MKNILSFAFAALTVTAAFAHDPAEANESSSAIIRNGSAFKLCYESAKPSNVSVTIFDESGDLVLNDAIKNTNGFIKPYDFAELPKGDYRIVVNNGSKRETKYVSYYADGIARFANMERLTGQSKLLLSIPEADSDVVIIAVYGQGRKQLHSSLHSVEGSFSKILNVEKVDGPFTVEVTDSSGYTKAFDF